MKSVKELIVLFIGIVLANAFSLQAMSMRMEMAPRMQMQMKSKQLLCTLAAPKQEDPKEKRKKAREQEDTFVNNLLSSGADLNEDTGSGRPLERVTRLKSIKTLLQNGADPKLCEKSPLISPLTYYVERVHETPAEGSSIEKDPERRRGKAIECWSNLLASRAKANQEKEGTLPLHHVIRLYNNFYIHNSEDFFKLLIWHGANPHKIESRLGKSAIFYSLNCGQLRNEKYLKQERQKYEAICQLLKGHKDEDSPLSMLPEDIFKEIRILIRHGVPFNPPPEKSALQIEPVAHDPHSSLREKELKRESEKKEQRAPLNYTRRRYNPTSLIIMGIAASNIGYWLYKKWQNHKKKQNEIYL